MSTEEKIAGLREEYAAGAGSMFDRWLELACESPIERLLLGYMLSTGWGPNEHPFNNWNTLHRKVAALGFRPTPWILGAEHSSCFCVLQLPVSFGPLKYRVDFAFIECSPADKPALFAVELDGHDFHERTKAQASRDKRRDRAFAANGWTTLRYPGSDVYAAPAVVLEEIVGIANLRCWPWMETESE